MSAAPELPFELAAAYALARTLPRDKLLLSIHAKNGISVLRLMGPGLKVALGRWNYEVEQEPAPVVYNYRLNSTCVRREFRSDLRQSVDRMTFLPTLSEDDITLIRLLQEPENL